MYMLLQIQNNTHEHVNVNDKSNVNGSMRETLNIIVDVHEDVNEHVDSHTHENANVNGSVHPHVNASVTVNAKEPNKEGKTQTYLCDC